MDPILEDLDPAEAIEANQIQFWADLGRSPLVVLHDGPEVVWLTSDVPSAALNRVLRARFEPGDVQARIEASLAPFRARRVPILWHTGPTTRPGDLGQHLVAHGLARVKDEPGMALELRALGKPPPLPAGLRVERVRDRGLLRVWNEVFGLAFGAPDSTSEVRFAVEASLSLDPDSPRRLYAGLLAGEVVATSLLFLGAGVAGLYAVGVLPQARRRGIGRAMTVVPLLEARRLGYRVGTLHASGLGQGIYRRLGFREYCRLGCYIWEEPGPGGPHPPGPQE